MISADWVGETMTQVNSEHLELPTPCVDFDAARLMGHLVGTARRSLGTATLKSTTHVPHVSTDLPEAALAVTYAELSRDAAIAWLALNSTTWVQAPWGGCRALDALRGFTVETVVHGWDLAVATDQPPDAPVGVAERCLGYAESVIPARLRGVMYDTAIPPTSKSEATERLANLLGRRRP